MFIRCQSIGGSGAEKVGRVAFIKFLTRLRRNYLPSDKNVPFTEWQKKCKAGAIKLHKVERSTPWRHKKHSEHKAERIGEIEILRSSSEETQPYILHRQPVLCNWCQLYILLCPLHQNHHHILRSRFVWSIKLLLFDRVLLCGGGILQEGHWMLQKIS